MTAGSDDDRSLREAFSSLSRYARPREDCPAPDRLWSAVRGELPPSETRRLVNHTASCPACAEAWRLAREVVRESPGEASEVERPSPAASGRRWRYASLAAAAAAAAVLAVVGVLWVQSPGGPPDSVYRQAEEGAIRSLVPDEEALPRDRVLLRWSGPEEARYDLRVSTEALDVLVTAEGLEEPEYLVRAAELEELPPSARLLWQVEATLPDGGRLASKTFVSRLE